MHPPITVVWRSYHDSPARGYYDQTLLEWLFDQMMPGGYRFTHSSDFPSREEGVVLVTPGHWRDATEVNEDLRGRPWVLLIITSDEEGLCPFWQIQHPNISIWKHTPRADLPWQPDRALPLGWTPGTLEANTERPEKVDDWFFAGQITHGRREEAARAMRGLSGGKLVATSTFLQTEAGGLNRREYFDMMRRARVVPCPSGPNIPDTFRFYEALECGAVPLADVTCPRGDRGYWHKLFADFAPPIIEDWSTLPQAVATYSLQHLRVEALAWWERVKRDLIWRLHDDLAKLGAPLDKPPIGERITVLIPTSPIPSHPSTEIIEQTLNSVRQRLPLAEILVMCDGVRPELAHYLDGYTDYLESLIWLCRRYRATPYLFDRHTHQIGMTRQTLEQVRTDLVLFVEHDTPLVGEIPFERLGEVVMMDDVRVARLYHEEGIPREHRYLMRGPIDLPWNGRKRIKLQKTVQWSQRPHLTTTENYRQLLAQFHPEANAMIEDALYGQVEAGRWEDHKVAIYQPEGSMKRSMHLNGRETDSKFEEVMTW